MTVGMKLTLVMGSLVFANVAAWGAKQMFAGMFDPILRALGS